MTNRITRIVVMPVEPFPLHGADKPLPPGRYEITTEEEPLGDVMEPAYRRIAATIYIPPPPGRIALGQIIDLDAGELAALLGHRVSAAA